MANEKSNKEFFQEQVQKPLQDILKDKKTFISSGTSFLGNMYDLFAKPIDWLKDFLASDWIYYIFLFIAWMIILQIAWKYAICPLYCLFMRTLCWGFRRGIREYDYY